jgi:hypothetical protein
MAKGPAEEFYGPTTTPHLALYIALRHLCSSISSLHTLAWPTTDLAVLLEPLCTI